MVPPPTSLQPSVLAFALSKGGSTMLFDLLQLVCPAAGLAYRSIPDSLFMANTPRLVNDVGPAFWPTGYCYGGFRSVPRYPVPILDRARTIWLVRDPRDALVSGYFSLRFSHVTPPGEGEQSAVLQSARAAADLADLDHWTLANANDMQRKFSNYLSLGLQHRSNVVIYRYEDVVFDKRRWLGDILEWYGWQVPPHVAEAALAHVDVIPAEPRHDQHIRQVRPGNHRELLAEPTRQRLARLFRNVLKQFDYQP